jgi:hypothetical protein
MTRAVAAAGKTLHWFNRNDTERAHWTSHHVGEWPRRSMAMMSACDVQAAGGRPWGKCYAASGGNGAKRREAWYLQNTLPCGRKQHCLPSPSRASGRAPAMQIENDTGGEGGGRGGGAHLLGAIAARHQCCQQQQPHAARCCHQQQQRLGPLQLTTTAEPAASALGRKLCAACGMRACGQKHAWDEWR